MGTSLLAMASDVRLSLIIAKARLKFAGIDSIITSTKRSSSEQKRLFEDFQKGLRRFPVARPGTSAHEIGRAVDIVPVNPADLPQLVEIMRATGFRWAGPSDRVHFDILEAPLGAGPLDFPGARFRIARSVPRRAPSRPSQQKPIPIPAEGGPC